MQNDKRELTIVAEALLGNEIGVIEASRRVVSLRVELKLFDYEVLDVFRAIESSTDHLILNYENFPLSEDRKHANEIEIKDYENYYREAAEKACHEIISDINGRRI